MLQRGGDAHFLGEARRGRRAEQLPVQHLHRDVSALPRIVRAVHDRRAARPERLEQLEAVLAKRGLVVEGVGYGGGCFGHFRRLGVPPVLHATNAIP